MIARVLRYYVHGGSEEKLEPLRSVLPVAARSKA